MSKLTLKMSALLLMPAVIALNGCAVMAARTGVRAVKNIREEEREREAAPAGTNAPPSSGFIHRPHLLHGDRQAGATGPAAAQPE